MAVIVVSVPCWCRVPDCSLHVYHSPPLRETPPHICPPKLKQISWSGPGREEDCPCTSCVPIIRNLNQRVRARCEHGGKCLENLRRKRSTLRGGLAPYIPFIRPHLIRDFSA